MDDNAAHDADFIARTLASPVHDIVRVTPLQSASVLSLRYGRPVLFKREDRQPGFCVKLRGVYAALASLPERVREAGLVTAVSGNTAIAWALATAHCHVPSTVVTSPTYTRAELDALRVLGENYLQLVTGSPSYTARQRRAIEIGQNTGRTYFDPTLTRQMMIGAATIGREILDQYHAPIDRIFVPVVSGCLAAGIGAFIKAISPQVRIIGVQGPTDRLYAMPPLPACDAEFHAHHPPLASHDKVWHHYRTRYLDELLAIEPSHVIQAMREIHQATRTLVEPAGAWATAGMALTQRNKNRSSGAWIAIVSGANMPFERIRLILDGALMT